MRLSKYISDLLFEHDCVTVPEFGSFLGNYKSAEYDLEQEKFFPPKKQISFNSQIKDNDGLLAKYISKELNISYNEAIKKIQTVVLSWKEKIKAQTVPLENLGEFYLNDESKLVFVPDLKVNHLKDSFGLSPIFATKLDNIDHVYSETPKTINVSTSIFRRAAIWVLLLIGLGSAIYINEKNYIIEKQIAFEKDLREKTVEKVQKAVFNFGSIPSMTVNVKLTENKFFIIAGAFRISQNADNLVENLKSKGYDATKLQINEKGLSPVAFTSFFNRQEAVVQLRIIQSKENKDAWIFESN